MSSILNYFCSCKSRKSQEDVLDPTTLDIIKVINRKRKNTNVDELNISYHGYKKEKVQDYNCFSIFDACYNKNDDDIIRTDYNIEYATASLSQE